MLTYYSQTSTQLLNAWDSLWQMKLMLSHTFCPILNTTTFQKLLTLWYSTAMYKPLSIAISWFRKYVHICMRMVALVLLRILNMPSSLCSYMVLQANQNLYEDYYNPSSDSLVPLCSYTYRHTLIKQQALMGQTCSWENSTFKQHNEPVEKEHQQSPISPHNYNN